MTTDPKESFMMRSIEKLNPQLLQDGVDFYLSRFVAAINEGNAADMPCMVAALRMAEKGIRESGMWIDDPHTERIVDFLCIVMRPQFFNGRMPSETAIKDAIEKLRKKDSGDVQEEV